jgi:HSP20 family protein
MTAGDPRIFLWAEACAIVDRAERLRRQFFQPNLAPNLETDVAAVQAANREPPIDLFETRLGLSVIAALPGVEAQDIAISLKSGMLQVAGQRRLPATRGAAIHRLEIPYGRFERRIDLPTGRFELHRSALSNGCLLVSLNRLS